jgi:hypothetical protein
MNRVRWREVFYGIAFIVSSLLFCAVLVEIMLRLGFREQAVSGIYSERYAFSPFQLTAYRHTPGYRGSVFRPGVFDTSVEISQFGLRQNNVEEQQGLSSRLLLLGDSFTFGLGVEEDETFATLLQFKLNPFGIGVVNGGQSGFSILQEVAWGRYVADKLTPDIVVLCAFLSNDIRDDYRGFENVTVKNGYRTYGTSRGSNALTDFLYSRSYLYRFTSSRVKKILRNHPDFHPGSTLTQSTEETMAPTLEGLLSFKGYLKRRNIRFGVFLVPSRRGETAFDMPLKVWLQEQDIPVLDGMAQDFDEGDYFIGDDHWNAQGHRKAAAHLSHFVSDSLLAVQE